MIRALLRHALLIMISLLALSFISYIILMRDPLNAELAQPRFYSGYVNYVNGLLHGDLGITYSGGDSLLTLIFTVLPPTIELCIASMLLAVLLGIPLGIIGAVNRQNFVGKSISAVSSLGLSVPVFWVAPLLMYFSAIYDWEISSVGQFNLLYEIKPITGFAIIDVWFMDEDYRLKVIQNVLQHLALPTIVLMISPTMEVTRFIQQRAETVFNQNYVKVEVTRGWSTLKILRKRILRNTLPLLVPEFARIFALVFAYSMLIENIIGWPGIGRWIIDAVSQQDYNSISAGVVVIGSLMICINVVTNVTTFMLDPFNRKGWYAR
ncbi:cationic peptide transport system permease protein [Cricetibacter osteomyelitidis]|uniref:Cationic peptide transport system permease protein n=1 Tax=Cricetibacter osteomyelitidis TaxID=1521931 RepID=A0A4R2T514_9PAST|nr:ABC transporter permease subunit [Cricetibacter osteomyelitidis]TCP92168.1 cationic peptide transport system permease protein [Cricetibacter osteomyelitidis]